MSWRWANLADDPQGPTLQAFVGKRSKNQGDLGWAQVNEHMLLGREERKAKTVPTRYTYILEEERDPLWLPNVDNQNTTDHDPGWKDYRGIAEKEAESSWSTSCSVICWYSWESIEHLRLELKKDSSQQSVGEAWLEAVAVRGPEGGGKERA